MLNLVVLEFGSCYNRLISELCPSDTCARVTADRRLFLSAGPPDGSQVLENGIALDQDSRYNKGGNRLLTTMEEKKAYVRQFNVFDDTFFEIVAKDAVEDILRIILHDSELVITKLIPQNSIKTYMANQYGWMRCVLPETGEPLMLRYKKTITTTTPSGFVTTLPVSRQMFRSREKTTRT